MSDTQRVAVVSGGGTGIGRSIARHLMDDGMHVVITGRRQQVLADAAAELEGTAPGGSVSWMRCDAADPADVQALVDSVGEAHGTIDAVVSNAGGAIRVPTSSLEELADHWRRTFEQNALTSVLTTSGFLPLLRRPGGRIILISSMASRSGGGTPAYGAVKAMLNGWVLNLASTYGRDGITANVVLPGYTPDTELFGDGMPQEMHDRIVSRIAVGRAGRSDDVGAAVAYFVSPAASFVTGQLLEVSGGNLPPSM
ncbi:MAG: SDR family oxidoreductase [Ilumatobacteraceae bacterium]